MKLMKICVFVVSLAASALNTTQAAEETNLLVNGSFEAWTLCGADYLKEKAAELPAFGDAEPAIPVRWTWNIARPQVMRRSKEPHGGQYALSVSLPKGAPEGQLAMAFLELNPGSTYSFGVWVKGTGKVGVRLLGKAIEGMQELVKASGDAGASWRRIGGKVTVPGHIRLVMLQVIVAAPAEVTLDDAHVSCPLAEPYNADDVLLKKYGNDPDTVLMEDFEKKSDQLTLEGKARLTDESNGRFGRGLRVDKPDFATLSLKVDKMPPEGTVECWVSPDSVRTEGSDYYLTVAAAGEVLGRVNGWSGGVFWGWPKGDGHSNYIEAPKDYTAGRIQKGRWMHVALTWDAAALRFYVDGALVDLSTVRSTLWSKTPTNIVVGGVNVQDMWDGVTDEIRLSKVKRYGPRAPTGEAVVALAAPAPAPEQAAPKEPLKPAIDVAAERKKLIGKIVSFRNGVFETRANPDGDFLYEASSAKPLVSDSPFSLEADKFAKGLTTAMVQNCRARTGQPDNDGAYWKLREIPAGRYWVGVLFQSNVANKEAPAPGLAVYLNGRIIQCSTMSEPVQAAPGVWFAEAQSAGAEELKMGDEIAVCFAASGEPGRIARLVLHTKEPRRGANRIATNFGGDWSRLYTLMGVNVEARFMSANGNPAQYWSGHGSYQQFAASPKDLLVKEGKAIAQCLLGNPLPVEITVDYECVIKGYYGQVAGQDKQRLTLPAHTRLTREVQFDLTADDKSYGALATVKAVSTPDLGWPEADTVEYFPGYRQSVPWPDAFNYKDTRRLFFTEWAVDTRAFRSLDGAWDVAMTTDLNPPVPAPANLEFKPCMVPSGHISVVTTTPRQHGAYFRRTLELPADAASRTHRLVLSDAIDEATAYVNGKKVGNVRGGNAMLICDITDTVKPGKNELIIVARDIVSVMDPAYVNPQSPTPSTLYLDAPGIYGQNDVGIFHVWLETAPAVSASDVIVLTSVRQKKLTARASLLNHTNKAVRATVKATVLEARKPVFELGAKEVTVEAGKAAPVEFEKAWENPRLWSPQDPHLYVLAVEITNADTNERLDLARERFGFRESWIDGPNIMLNGARVKLKGVGTPSAPGARIDFQLSRSAHTTDNIGFDYCDEFGYMMSQDITGIWNQPSRHNVERDAFWETCTKNMLTNATRTVNHPCIIAWDLSNEWVWYLGYGTSDGLGGAKRFKTLGDTMQRFDPTRWVFFDGDADLMGLHDNYSFHYMNPYYYGYTMNGHSAYFPDGAFWGSFEKGFDPADDVSLCPHQKDLKLHPEKKVMMDTENLWKTGGLMPPGMSRYVGEDDVLSPAVDSGAGAIAWYWKQNLDGHRDAMTSSISYYGGVTGAARRGYMLQTFILPDVVHHGFSGRTFEQRYTLLNDVFSPAGFVLRWKLIDAASKTIVEGKDERRMTSGDLQRGKLSFKLPAVAARTTFVLDVRLEADGKFAYAEQRDIEVWPDQDIAAGKLGRRVVLFDPNNSTASALKAAGVEFAKFEKLQAPEGQAAQTLMIVGEGALDEANAASAANLAKFVEDGGRLLILAQTVTPGGLSANTKLESREWASQVFPLAAKHPILRGVTWWDLHFWAADRSVGRGSYTKPEGGPATVLADTGAVEGMEWVQLMELYRGDGLYLLCQLPLIAKYNEEPMAREILAKTLRYGANENAYRAPTGRLKAIIARASQIEDCLTNLSVSMEVVPADAPLDGKSVVLVEAVQKATEAQRDAWAAAVKSGATLVVCNVQPADAGWLSGLAGRPVRVTVPLYHMWSGRGCRTSYEQPVAGVGQCDVYWKQHDDAEGSSAQAEDAKLVIEPLQDFAVAADGARELVYPGAFIELSVGKGRLLIDQRRWMTANEKLSKYTLRNVSALMLGLGVQIAPMVVPRQLPQGLAYRQIDLTAFADRALADETPDDGKGGWTDQGASADLRTFPTGEQNFQGVPFLISKFPKSCIVLASGARPFPELLPNEVTIPVGFPVEGLYFLHSCAYSGSGMPVGLYQVQYADGTVTDIPLVSDVNIRDWASPPGPFLRERGTSSAVAWTGSCPMFSQIGIYRLLWVNPKPEVAVKALRFANPARSAVPVLLGLTAAVAKDQKPQAPEAAAKAQDLLAQATKTSDAGQTDKAIGLLRQAIGADPTLAAAHQMLGELCERSGDEEAALKAYQAWIQAGAQTPLPYNRTGQILEKRKDFKGALEAYTQSLKVEWNQPWTIEGKARMEKMLAGQK